MWWRIVWPCGVTCLPYGSVVAPDAISEDLLGISRGSLLGSLGIVLFLVINANFDFFVFTPIHHIRPY